MSKIIITGSGRAGTTFLMMLFTRLGLDTGYEPFKEPYDETIRAGCEYSSVVTPEDDLEAIYDKVNSGPRIMKSPDWSKGLKFLVQAKLIDLEHVFLPIRDIHEAAKSRLDAGLDWQIDKSSSYDERLQQQIIMNAYAIGRTVEVCFLYEIPCTLMKFPLLVEDEEYCYQKITRCFSGIDREEFSKIYRYLVFRKE